MVTFNEIYYTVDKSEWGNGAWDNEPDKVVWVSPTGLDCMIVRNGRMGNLCGYVGVPEGHRFYGLYYEHVDVDVHGGLTYSRECQEGNRESYICHVPLEGRPAKVWWLGFDCAHSMDLVPGLRVLEACFAPRFAPHRSRRVDYDYYDTYRTIAYVQAEVERLAAQLVPPP